MCSFVLLYALNIVAAAAAVVVVALQYDHFVALSPRDNLKIVCINLIRIRLFEIHINEIVYLANKELTMYSLCGTIVSENFLLFLLLSEFFIHSISDVSCACIVCEWNGKKK